MMLAAIETVANADPVWDARGHKSDLAAQATASELGHGAYPLTSGGRIVAKKSPVRWAAGVTLSGNTGLPLYSFRTYPLF
jgi:hypothetical protein